MKKMTLQAVCTMVGCLLMAMCTAPAFAQVLNEPAPDIAPGTHYYILMIHGRHSPCTDYTQTSCPEHEVYGVFANDQANYWIDSHKNPHIPTNTNATVLFVQWDAWNRGFDDTTSGGGHNEVRLAIDNWCNFANHQSCRIICHSAGCAAFENWLAKSSYGQTGNSLFIGAVIAAGSAAGGSEAALELQKLSLDGTFDPAAIDSSLEPGNARTIYDHNTMKGIAIRGIAGTLNPYNSSYLGLANTQCHIFPGEPKNALTNPDCFVCQECPPGGLPCVWDIECADDSVALHSSGGWNQAAAWDMVDSLLPGATVYDPKSMYQNHGWWINDTVCAGGTNLIANCNNQGPFSNWGKNAFNPTYNTYRVNHGDSKDLAIDEYDACHNIHPRLCP